LPESLSVNANKKRIIRPGKNKVDRYFICYFFYFNDCMEQVSREHETRHEKKHTRRVEKRQIIACSGTPEENKIPVP
jgi:hypothetical protein